MGTKKGCGNDQHAADGLRARLHEIAYRDSAASVTVRADDLRAILAALPPPHEAAAAPRFALRNGQVAQLFDFGGTPPVGTPLEDQDVLVIQHAEAGHSGPGLYAHYEDHPEEGALFLNGVLPARPKAPPLVPMVMPGRRVFSLNPHGDDVGYTLVIAPPGSGESILDSVRAVSKDAAAAILGNANIKIDASPNGRSEGQAAVAAIAFALDSATDGIAFLRSWNEGDFDAIRKWWPEAPEAVYVGADPLHVQASSQGGEVSDA